MTPVREFRRTAARVPMSEAERMVEEQIRSRGIRSPAVLRAMRSVPRDRFVPPEVRHLAWEDGPLGIGMGQTISQPYIVALMTEALDPEPEDRVLEVGTGSGYQAAVLAHCVRQVVTIERHAELADRARETLRDLGIGNVEVRTGDGARGLPEEGPFDGILVAAAPARIPDALMEQLRVGARLVIPVGEWDQDLWRITRRQDGIERERLCAVRFVPLIETGA